MSWQIDSRLAQDTNLLYDDVLVQIRLMNNKAVPWFVVVPKVNVIEWYQLSAVEQNQLNQWVNDLSQHLASDYKAEKINVATLGNVVEQMHILVLGRYKNDAYWPKPVWGLPSAGEYTLSEVIAFEQKLRENILG